MKQNVRKKDKKLYFWLQINVWYFLRVIYTTKIIVVQLQITPVKNIHFQDNDNNSSKYWIIKLQMNQQFHGCSNRYNMLKTKPQLIVTENLKTSFEKKF